MDSSEEHPEPPMIVTPPKLYMDTCHLVNMSLIGHGERLQDESQRPAYDSIDTYLRSHRVGLIFNMSSALEWVEGNATLASALAIADVVDSAQLRCFVEADQLVYAAEVLAECRRLSPSIDIPEIPPLQVLSPGGHIVSSLAEVAKRAPGFVERHLLPPYIENVDELPSIIPVVSAERHVRETFRFKTQYPSTYQARIAGFREAVQRDIDEGRALVGQPKRFFTGWAKGFLKVDKILQGYNPGLDVDPLLSRVDLANCPAASLFFLSHAKRVRSRNPPKDNDVDDWGSVAVFPYADVVLTEKQLRAFMLQADKALSTKIFAKADEAVAKLTEMLR